MSSPGPGGGGVRVGLGYDIHRLVPGRPLFLGGERIDHPLGLEGHSDADVLLHALADAILGAAGLGDIGEHFPPGEERWRGIAGLDLLGRVVAMARGAGWRVASCDLVLLAESPRLAPHRTAIRERIAGVLEVSPGAVGLKATTNEGLGAVGRGQGIAAMAVALLEADAQ